MSLWLVELVLRVEEALLVVDVFDGKSF